MALTKAELAEALFEQLGMSKRDAKDTVEVFFEEIRKALESGEQVKLSGFGNFDLRDKNERPGRNPKTYEDIPITARRRNVPPRAKIESPCREHQSRKIRPSNRPRR